LSVEKNFVVVYEQDLPLEVRIPADGIGGGMAGTTEPIHVRMLVLPRTNGELPPSRIKIELSSEVDIFFYYIAQ
jgi:hypothetical protein